MLTYFHHEISIILERIIKKVIQGTTGHNIMNESLINRENFVFSNLGTYFKEPLTCLEKLLLKILKEMST